MKRRATLFGALACAALMFTATPAALASNYPAQPIRAIVPFPAGGINDTVGRLVLNQLARTLGTEVIIDNRPGAGGMIGTKTAVDSSPDGYTVLLGAASTIAVAPNLYRSAKYKPATDLVPIGGIAAVPSVMVVNAQSKINSMSDLLDAARKAPGRLNYGSAGPGTSHHVQTTMMALQTKVDITHVPYKGGAPAMTDLIGNQIDMLLEPLPTALSHIQSGRVRPIGVTSATRNNALPDVPTFQETGLQGYEASTWFGLFAPTGVPQDVVARLSEALMTTLSDPALVKDMEARGITPMPMDAAAFATFVSRENTTMAQLIQEANLQVD